MADQGLVAEAARIPAGLLDDAVAGGDDRRAAGRCPIDAGMHAAKPRIGCRRMPKPEVKTPFGTGFRKRNRRMLLPSPSK